VVVGCHRLLQYARPWVNPVDLTGDF